MKRRTLLGGLAGLSVAGILGGTGLGYRYYRTQHPVQAKTTRLNAYQDDTPDVCIIGTGPGGCIVAHNLAKAGKRVVMLDSGASITDPATGNIIASLDKYSSSGGIDYPLQTTRIRALGGTSNIWTGRCPRLLPRDFQNNPLAPGGAWPLSYEQIAPYYDRAEQSLGVTGDHLTAGHAPRTSDLPGSSPVDISELRALIEPMHIHVDYPPLSREQRYLSSSGPVRFAQDYLVDLSNADKVTVIEQATATHFTTDESGVVKSVVVNSLDGVQREISAKTFVIACGAVESARLLLLSKTTNHPEGLGNERDQVGRRFMEHPFVTYTATIPGMKAPTSSQLGRNFEFVNELKDKGLGGIILGIHIDPYNPDKLEIALGIEMAPDPENRVTLNESNKDAFGNPGANLNLSFSEKDKQLLDEGEKIVYGLFSKVGGVDIVKETDLHWSHHHLGTTRMGTDPDVSVVDKNLKVHGIQNLYVSSSGNFVTAGVGNPTLTIVALAHRLSDHLKQLG